MTTNKPGRALRTVGVFDSGVGGLSVLQAIRREHAAINFIYLADSAHAPYGSRSTAFIEQRASRIAAALVDAGAEVIVVACNTATAVAVARLRAQLAVPVVAMEPAIKPAVACTRSGVVGVLATERTLESPAVARLCEEFGAGATILLQACPGLAEHVERGELSSPTTIALLRELLAPLLTQGADTLVLGCTHYVFLQPVIRDIVGPQVQIIESSAAVARQVLRRLRDQPRELRQGGVAQQRFLTTGSPQHAQTIFSTLWGEPVEVQALAMG